MKTQDVNFVIKQWKKVNLENLIYLKFYWKENYFRLRYEDLCNNTNTKLSELCDFLNIHFEKNVTTR